MSTIRQPTTASLRRQANPSPSPASSPFPPPANLASPSGPAVENSALPMSDSRKRQSRRDEAIRRKNESDLNKKVVISGKSRQVRRPPPGTVLALRPSPALQIKPNTTVAEAAQLMSAKRENCVLVTDDDDRIAGIFTAKDLAFRVVGAGIDARDVTIEQIMTKNPLCARTDTSATDALDLMVRKGFRHLPVMDENQDISGVLDITKCFHEAMEKLERAYQSSRKLYDALEGVQSELGASQPLQIIQYVEALKTKMSGPSLESVLDGNPATFVNIRTSVKEAAQLMKENHTTAVLVTDKNAISGIFTSKDVVLRVIAAGLDPSRCSVVRVMTPHPDFAPKEMSIQAALRKMHDGHYLNLPVMGDDSEIVGMVDVLKLTYATLEQINSMQTADNEGPAWNKFWLSLDNDTDSVHSDHLSHRATTPYSDSIQPPPSSPPIVMQSEFQYGTDVEPGDSASHFAEETAITNPSLLGRPAEESPFTFKFKTPSGRVHRIHLSASEGFLSLREVIAAKLGPENKSLGGPGEYDEEGKMVKPGFAVSYLDDEGDAVLVTSDLDLFEAIQLARRANLDKVDIFVHHPDQAVVVPPPPSTIASTVSQPVTPTNRAPKENEKAVEDTENKSVSDVSPAAKPISAQPQFYNSASPAPPRREEAIPGIPNELLLPGALVTLAASILTVFLLSRVTK
ncbi:hypothetical protein V1517DRAFT_169949 [Lipomyces orientalis]|uniref:Uncharacterized protein n=1 Tax=Lipomyces orientalis TaxID=1233043 RepID=A0ACC3TND1_9ASCO